MFAQSSFEIRANIKGCVNLNKGSQTSDTQNICSVQDATKTIKMVSLASNGQPKTVHTNANIAAVAGLINETPCL